MKRMTYRLEDQYGNPTDSIILESDLIFLNSSEKLKKCGSCGHFHRIPGTKRGTCDIRRWERNRLGQTEPWRHSFTPSQSYGACRDYIPREDDNHG